MSNTRTEHDLLGEVAVPRDALYGAHTQRAIDNFPLRSADDRLGRFAGLVRALLLIKMSAARANLDTSSIERVKTDGIVAACQELLSSRGLSEHFPISILHGGGGTAANMNANEVIGNVVSAHAGDPLGTYRRVGPVADVNLHQSTNDVYPTACRLAILEEVEILQGSLRNLAATYRRVAAATPEHRRIARTCFQDAKAIPAREWLLSFSTLVDRLSRCLGHAVSELETVNLGGGMVGRRDETPAAYKAAVIIHLREATGRDGLRIAEDLFDAAQNADDLVRVAAELETIARCLIKLASDLRVLSSGPEAGFAEVLLPRVQAGSSALAAKVNPVIPEYLMQLCFQVVGQATSCRTALDHAELELNVWEGSMVHDVLESTRTLAVGIDTFARRCIAGLTLEVEVNERNATSLLPSIERLQQEIGYEEVTSRCRTAGTSLMDIRRALGLSAPTD